MQNPIFVVGCNNSGTTILWKTLLSHPEVCGPSVEGQDLIGLPDSMKHFFGKETFRLFASDRFNNAYRRTEQNYNVQEAELIRSIYLKHHIGEIRFIEKSPSNSVRTRYLQSIFPQAQFIILVRNGYAVCEGTVRKRFFDPERPHMAGLKTSYREAANHWENVNSQLFSDIEYLNSYLVLSYESLVTQPLLALARICKFSNLRDYFNQNNIPIFNPDLNKIQIARLSASEKQIITYEAFEMLKKLDYLNEDSVCPAHHRAV